MTTRPMMKSTTMVPSWTSSLLDLSTRAPLGPLALMNQAYRRPKKRLYHPCFDLATTSNSGSCPQSHRHYHKHNHRIGHFPQHLANPRSHLSSTSHYQYLTKYHSSNLKTDKVLSLVDPRTTFQERTCRWSPFSHVLMHRSLLRLPTRREITRRAPSYGFPCCPILLLRR